MLKGIEKFLAFSLTGAALVAFGFLIYLHPLEDSTRNSGVLQIINMIIGALIGGFGAAVGALLKSNSDTVTVDNTPANPVPTTDKPKEDEETPPAPAEELPSYAQ